MKISEVILFLQNKQKEIGDVELYKEENDGRSTWTEKYKPSIVFTNPWKGHPDPKRWRIQ